MAATATTPNVTSFFSPDLLATRNPDTANLCAKTWVTKLEMGLLAAIQLTQDLRAEVEAENPQKQTINALYKRILALHIAHEGRDYDPPQAKALSDVFAPADAITSNWYIGTISSPSNTRTTQAHQPTIKDLKIIEDALTLLTKIDLAAAAKTYIDRYNGARKPGQVFLTPVDLLKSLR